MTLLFPHKSVRPSQQDMVDRVTKAVKNGTNLLIHAPTGLGKTAASIAPALSEAIDKGLTIYFLTSRHTQHDIAMKTLEEIKQRHGKPVNAVDIIGKKWMCLQSGVDRLPASEFTEFCRALREDGKCDFYTNFKKGEKLTFKGEMAVKSLLAKSPVRNQLVLKESEENSVCPYYISMEIAKKAKVVVGDYYYIFHPKVREQFFARCDKELEDAVIVVDEAHNLPNRIKDLASARLSSLVLKRALKEAVKNNLDETANRIDDLYKTFLSWGSALKTSGKDERYILKSEFMEKVERLGEYEILIETLSKEGDAIREDSQVSYVGAVGSFLEEWKKSIPGFTRILSVKKGFRDENIILSYRCMDPSLISMPVFNQVHSTILMSGTLQPTSMYRELLDVPDCDQVTYPSPFPTKNRMHLIIPQTSTKFTQRGVEMYKKMAEVLNKVCAKVPGNVAVFFPSYYILKEVNKFFQTKTEKTVFTERQEMNSAEKQDFIDRFRQYKNTGAVLLGVISGNFGEGIDLPGDELKGVVVVGLPLGKPTLEIEALIKYYDEKFKKGWDYGYLFPAFNKTLQSAGRCIRSESDRGVIIYLDERYAWPNYKRCFPQDSEVKVSLLYEQLIDSFFNQ